MGRLPANSRVRMGFERITSLPVTLWLLLGVAAFTIPLLEYWMSAFSHPNGLAGYLPWADAHEYINCSESFLLGSQSADNCGKRSFYFSFFADLLWLTGNRLQFALVLQTLIVGTVTVVFTRELARSLNGPAQLAAYAVLYVFAAAFCTGLVMTENVGLLLGTIGIAVIWRSANAPRISVFLFGIVLISAGVSARPGPMFVLPALIGWYVFYAEGPLRKRLVLAALAIAVAAIAIGYIATPILVAGGTLGSTHSNFSYSLYGLVSGGKGWTQITIDHPEIFNQGDDGGAVTRRIYAVAIESILSKPHLFLLGYVKGVVHYVDDLFRYATDFKPLRLVGFLVPWVLGVWFTIKRWREPRYAFLLALQAGIIVSSPFIAIDGQNRVFASTVALDALFVAIGVMWISNRLASKKNVAPDRVPETDYRIGMLAGIGLAVLFIPPAMLAAVRPNVEPSGYQPPHCEPGLKAVVVHPGRSTLVLPLVKAGEETLFPLRVRGDHFRERFHKSVQRQPELSFPTGTSVVLGYRLDSGSIGQAVLFSWSGKPPVPGQLVGFCVRPPEDPHDYFGTATAMHKDVGDARKRVTQ
jgi:hypothetical protein